jgi:hypothetical protein
MRQGKIKIDSDLQLSTGATVNEFSTSLNDNNTSLPTGKAVKDYTDSLALGLDWQESVLDQINLVTSEPSSPSTGDRYINTATGTSSQTAQSVTINRIYEWNGSSWNEATPTEGFATWVEDEDILYVYNGSSWAKFGSTVTHANLNGIQGGTTDEYYHLTSQQHTDVVALLASPPSGIPSNMQVFTSSGTWVRPAGVDKVWVRVQGAGGGGGHSTTASNVAGGGGGGYCEGLVSVSSNVTVTVGTGGAHGSNSNGSAGGLSRFAGDTTLTAGGGGGGQRASTPSPVGGAGGTATGGTLNIPGGFGGSSQVPSGGSSILGGTGANNTDGDTYPTAQNYGVGGCGGSTSGTYFPSAGSNGVVIVMW